MKYIKDLYVSSSILCFIVALFTWLCALNESSPLLLVICNIKFVISQYDKDTTFGCMCVMAKRPTYKEHTYTETYFVCGDSAN